MHLGLVALSWMLSWEPPAQSCRYTSDVLFALHVLPMGITAGLHSTPGQEHACIYDPNALGVPLILEFLP